MITETSQVPSSQEASRSCSPSFTPGPWRASGEIKLIGGEEDETLHWCGVVHPVCDVGEYRGPICHIQSCNHIGGISRAEAAANAKAIAAVPDLIAALQEAREFIDGQIDVVDGSYGVPAPNRAMTLAQEIDAALEKAGAA